MVNCAELSEYDFPLTCSGFDYTKEIKSMTIMNPTERVRLPRKYKKELKKKGITKDLLRCFAAVGWHGNKNMSAKLDYRGQMIITIYHD